MARYASRLSTALTALGLTVACSTTHANHETEEFTVFDVFAELNHTDEDLGFHFTLDGGPWTSVAIKDPRRHLLWSNRIWGRLRQQGGTEIFFESAEPPFESDEEPTLTPEQFFARFREGDYKATGRAQGGGWLAGTDSFSHLMPAPPDNITVNSIPAPDSCDDEPLPELEVDDFVIAWDEVTQSHPTVGTPGEEIEVSLYQVVAEVELEGEAGEEFVSKFSVDINPPDETSMTIPESFVALAAGEELKFEVLVKEADGGNQTAVESCVVVLDEGND